MGSFFGRSSQLAEVQAACRRVLREQCVVAVVIEGDPGSGKTRLVAEALPRTPIDLRVAVASHEPESGLPLGVGLDLVRGLARSSLRARECLDPFIATANVGAELEWAGFFEAVNRAVSLSGPLLVAVDDVQWSDPRSVALLHYLVRGAEADGEALGLVLVGRPSPTLSAVSASLERLLADRLIHIRLGPLDHEAALALVHFVNPLLEQDAAEEAATRSGGSPFWCELLATAGTETKDVPQFVSDRLRGVSADGWAVLATIVLLARLVHLREVAEIQGWQEDRVRGVVAELSTTGLIVEDATSVRTAHDLVRSAVSSQIPDPERRSAHQLIASWLDDVAGDDVSVLLAAAQHGRAAGVDAAATLERIFRSPMRRSLGVEGLQAVVELIDDVASDGPRGVELQRGVAALAGEVGQYTIAMERWSRVAERLGAPIDRARAWLAACDAAQQVELAADARAYLEEARKLDCDDPVLALELSAAEASLLRWLEHRLDDAQQVANQALAQSRELVSGAASLEQVDHRIRRVYLQILVQACVGAMQRNALNDILLLADETSDVAAGLDVQASVQARVRSGSALMLVGRFDEAETRLAAGWTDARRSFLSDLALDVGAWLVWTRYLMGRLVDAEEVASECAALSARTHEHTRPAWVTQMWWHTIEISRGDRAAALNALTALAHDEADAHYRLKIHQAIATWLARLAVGTSAADAFSALHAGRKDADTAGCTRCQMVFLLSGSETLARLGSVADAQAWLREGERDANPEALDQWLVERARASVAVAAGDTSAGDRLQHAVTTADQLGMGLEAIWARLDLGQLLSATAPKRSSAVLQEAHVLAQGVGAKSEVRFAEQLLRQSGARIWRRGKTAATDAGRTALSPREEEIARLIAAGASNLDIAEQLFLSRRTVERHVSNIFVKRGVKNRAQLAASIPK